MTPHRKAIPNDCSHFAYSPRTGASACRRAPGEGQAYDVLVAVVNRNYGNPSDCGTACATRDLSVAAQSTTRRCVSALQVRSTVLLRGGVAWWNQDRISGDAGQDRTSEQLFIPGAKIFRGLVSWSGRCGPMIRLPALRSVRNARSATQVFSSTASASRTPRLCTRYMVRSLVTEYPRGVRYSSQGSLRRSRRHFGADDRSLAALCARLVSSRSESNQRLTPSTAAMAAARVASRPVTGRSVTATFERMDATSREIPAPKFFVGETCEPNVIANESGFDSNAAERNIGSQPVKLRRLRAVRGALKSIQLVCSFTIAIRRRSGSRSLMRSRKKFHWSISTPKWRNATFFAQTVMQKSIGMRNTAVNCRDRRSPQFSSGDGLGIQQPGSMTRGFASRRQPPSGRARDRAMCPAVARFIQGRVG